MNRFLRNFLLVINCLGLLVVLLPYLARIITSHYSVEILDELSSELKLNFEFGHRSSHSPVFFDSQIAPKVGGDFSLSADRISYQIDKVRKPSFVLEPYPKLYLFNNTKVNWNGSLQTLITYLTQILSDHDEIISAKAYREYRLDVIVFEKLNISLAGNKSLRFNEVIFDLKNSSVSFNGVLYNTPTLTAFNHSLARLTNATSEDSWEVSQNCSDGLQLEELSRLRLSLIGATHNLLVTNQVNYGLTEKPQKEICHTRLDSL